MKNSKKIDKIMQEHFSYTYSDIENHYFHHSLCEVFRDTEFETEWGQFWKKINTEMYRNMNMYFEHSVFNETKALLRLLVVEDFKMYMDEKQNRKEK